MTSGSPVEAVRRAFALLEELNRQRINSVQHLHKATALPKNGQSPDVQARDHYECYKFAVAHSGFDPMHVNGATAATQVAEQQSDYERAQAACFEGRGYSVQ